MNLIFFVNSVFLGIGLAMDAFSVSLANGLGENKMRFCRMCAIAGVYAFFQFFMPMVGWICVHTIVGYFSKVQFLIRADGFIPRRLRRNKGDETRVQLPYENNIPRCLRRGMLIPWIALFLLFYIGGKMIFESVSKKNSEEENPASRLSFRILLAQGIATSIDALSVGFTIAEYDLFAAISASLIIAAVTFLICMAGLESGKKVGTKLSSKA
ncbi:MAG: manganese efflux pump MntP family protein, partial [Treponemataceae bacterium]|nr:manganese efflux pump MntP family protein [Treponemataceae bacterium]